MHTGKTHDPLLSSSFDGTQCSELPSVKWYSFLRLPYQFLTTGRLKTKDRQDSWPLDRIIYYTTKGKIGRADKGLDMLRGHKGKAPHACKSPPHHSW